MFKVPVTWYRSGVSFAEDLHDVQPDSLGGVLLEALVRDTNLAIAVADSTGTIRMMSPALERLARAEYAPVPADSIPSHFNVFTEDGSRMLRPEEEPLNRTCRGESFHDEVVAVAYGDNEFVHLRCSGAPLRDDLGRTTGGIVLFDDVTGEHAALRQQAELRDRLVQTVNHELRTPLTTLLGHAELLEELLTDVPEPAAKSLRAVLKAGERLRDLAQTISDLVDLDQAQRVIRSQVDVMELVRDVVEAYEDEATRNGVELEVVSPETFVVEVDGTQLRKAVAALVDNAVKHAPSGTPVRVAVGLNGRSVDVVVTDRGPGIPERERKRVVQPFERGDVELTSPSQRGLGLAVARGVATAHRGRLALEDNEPSGLRAVLSVTADGAL